MNSSPWPDLMAHKFQNSVMDNTILLKQLENWRKEHGELLLLKTEIARKLAESQLECQTLRNHSESLIKQKDDLASKLNMEIEILKKQLRHFRDENEELGASKMAAEEEVRVEEEKRKAAEEKVRKVVEELERCERERKEELVRFEEVRKEGVEVLKVEKEKLERQLEVVMDAGTERFRVLEKVVLKLEQEMAARVGSSAYGPTQFGITEQAGSLGTDMKTKGSTGSQSIEVETASPVPSFAKSESRLPPISQDPQVIDINDTDDDDDYDRDDFPSPKRGKWELSSSEVPNERENGAKNCGEN